MKTATIGIEDLAPTPPTPRAPPPPSPPSLYSDQTAFFVKSDFQF